VVAGWKSCLCELVGEVLQKRRPVASGSKALLVRTVVDGVLGEGSELGGLRGEAFGVGKVGFWRVGPWNGQLFHVEQFEIASNDAP
jgi:hypothetical protein